MPFTPVTEADLAPAGGGFQPVSEADLAPDSLDTKPVPSTLEAVGRGALQGATLGFSDEITGALESILTDKTYKQARDESRAANAAAAEAHPIASGIAEFGAGLATPIPGLGAIKGAGLAAHAVKGAIVGGAAGLGASTANNFGDAVKDTVENALLGGAIGAVGGKIGQKLAGAGEAADNMTVKALAGAESNESKAAWQKTKRMVNNPETKSILHEPVQVETESGKIKPFTLAGVAGKNPEAIQQVVDAQVERIGSELRPIYAKADAKNGGVSVGDYMKFLDGKIAETSKMAPAEAKVYKNAIQELKDTAVEHWAPDLHSALATDEATNPQVRDAVLKQLDVRVPSEDVRAEATARQKIGFKTVDPLNPGLNTQVKRDLGNMVRDFVNQHVMQTLGEEDHSTLLGLNKRMNAWLGVRTVAEARAEKAAAGAMSGRGLLHGIVGHGSITAGVTGAMMGHPAALAAVAIPKAIEYAPAAARKATQRVAGATNRLAQVAEAAKAGNPFAAHLVSIVAQSPEGAARLAALHGPNSGQQ